MTAKQLELTIALVQTAAPLIAMIPALGAKWLRNKEEVQAMIDEGRDPTPAEHRRLAYELAGLNDALESAIETAIGAGTDADTDNG